MNFKLDVQIWMVENGRQRADSNVQRTEVGENISKVRSWDVEKVRGLERLPAAISWPQCYINKMGKRI